MKNRQWRGASQIWHHRLVTYCGAGSLLAPDEALKLDPDRWAWSPKVDGVYAVVELDGAGLVAAVTSRTGQPLREGAEMVGIAAGAPHSRLVGELEAHTEAGIRAAATRGWAALHLFDVLRYDGVDVGDLGYGQRWGLLHRGHSILEAEQRARSADWTADGRGRAHDAGGRYCRAIPRDLRRLPVVPVARGGAAGAELWRAYVDVGGGEGLVAVRLDAKAGARGAKRKVKVTDTLDAVVVDADATAAVLTAHGRTFTIGTTLRPPRGAVVELEHHGWYETSSGPRFARIVRVRAELGQRAAGGELH